MATLEDIYHRLGSIEARLEMREDHEARLKAVERWQHRAEARIAGMVAVAVIVWQGLKLALSRFLSV